MSDYPQTIVFRCLFGGKNGLGHVVRCSALAASFKREGWSTTLWTEGSGEGLPREVRACFDEIVTKMPEKGAALVIDEMYTADIELGGLAARWRQLGGCRLVVGIDDMAKRSLAGFDLVLNTELGRTHSSYRSKRTLLGERYALLREGFASPDEVDWELGESVLPVFVMLGGTDAFRYADRVLNCLWDWRGDDVAPVLVLGSGASNRMRVMDTAGRFRKRQILEGLSSAQVAAWMRFCRFGVIACGTTLYEAAAMQMPFIGLSLVDNQNESARKVEEFWGMPIVYRAEQHHCPLDLEYELEFVTELDRKLYSKVDTGGADRVRTAIEDLLEEGTG